MRVYKIDNQYVDLDHVLIVGELEFRTPYDDWDEQKYDAWFDVTFAFQDNQKKFGFRFPWDLNLDWIVEEEAEKVRKEYESFLYAWQNK